MTTTTEKIAKFNSNMKKFVAPAVLFVLAAGLVAYLALDFSGSRSSFNSEAYLAERAKIDSLEIELWNAQGNPDAQVVIRTELASSWETLAALRSGPVAEETAAPESGEQAAPETGFQSLSSDVIMWIVGGAAAIILCIVILVLLLKRRQVIITQRMEAVKAAERFKEPKGGFDDAATLVARPRPQKRSIIADAEEYAAQKRETMAHPAATPAEPDQKVAFEDENGIPENKILTGSPESKPTLRPTAKERITSAMQNLSDVLRAPRGLSRERTMRLRAQSHNVTGDPNLAGSSPLEITRFDRENSEKSKILQLSRRGVPASIIASRMKLPQDKVETIIRENQD